MNIYPLLEVLQFMELKDKINSFLQSPKKALCVVICGYSILVLSTWDEKYII